ncbi:MAG: hypothetical protein IMW84_10615 [Thermoanaerobacter sp.]|nr:hypothetical protein [Thermoanaerobacter sp.]
MRKMSPNLQNFTHILSLHLFKKLKICYNQI